VTANFIGAPPRGSINIFFRDERRLTVLPAPVVKRQKYEIFTLLRFLFEIKTKLPPGLKACSVSKRMGAATERALPPPTCLTFFIRCDYFNRFFRRLIFRIDDAGYSLTN
jgi:hypothetical protein